MECSSGEESDFSDSEIAEYKDKPYQQLRDGTLKVKYPNGILRCPFCAGKKKQNFKYKDLHQHASGVSKGSSNRNAKQKANHLALTLYLENELADEAETPLKVAAPVAVAPISEEKDLICWPWTGIVVNIVKEPDSGDEFENTEYWMKRFSKFKPEVVELLRDDKKQSAHVLVSFNNDWIGFRNAMEFEKYFEAAHQSRKEWNASESLKGSSIYAWLARANDFKSEGPIGDYLRTNTELKTVADLDQEAVKTRNKPVVELASEIDMRNEIFDDLQIKYNQKSMSLSRMLEEKDNLHQAFFEGLLLPLCLIFISLNTKVLFYLFNIFQVEFSPEVAKCGLGTNRLLGETATIFLYLFYQFCKLLSKSMMMETILYKINVTFLYSYIGGF